MEKSKKFIDWLSKKMNLKSDQEIKSALQKMGEDGIRKKYEEFQQEEESETESMKNGGKFDYIKCLQAFKKGGSMYKGMKKCGCGSVMEKGSKIPKAFLGAVLSGLGSLGKAASTASNVLGTVKGLMTPMMATQNVSTVAPSQVPGNITPTTQTKSPDLQQRTIPKVKMEDGGEMKDKKLEKLKSLKGKKKVTKK